MKILPTILLSFILLGGLNLVSADSGPPSTPNYDGTPPAFLADVTVPDNVAWRAVFGSIQLTPTALNAAFVTIQMCGGPDLIYVSNPAAELVQNFPYSFVVRGGDCYEFVNTLPAGGNSISLYSTFDILNQSFEGQAHANSTWESRAHANATHTTTNATNNATFEGQAHANATWESQAHANETWESQAHANETWCPLTGLGCTVAPASENGNFTGNFTGNVTFLEIAGTIETAFDPWIPVLILGGVAVVFALARFFLPMIAALLSLVAQLFDPPIFGIPGACMIIGIAIVLQIMYSAFATNRD